MYFARSLETSSKLSKLKSKNQQLFSKMSGTFPVPFYCFRIFTLLFKCNFTGFKFNFTEIRYFYTVKMKHKCVKLFLERKKRWMPNASTNSSSISCWPIRQNFSQVVTCKFLKCTSIYKCI